MQTSNSKTDWELYVEKELAFFKPILESRGFILDTEQVHTKGERYAFRAQKIILTGRRKVDNLKIVIKVTREKEGEQEIINERRAKDALKKIDFAYHEFLDPNEIFFVNSKEYTILVTEFIEEEISFLKRDAKEQFSIILNSFTVQEGIHAVTNKHNDFIEEYFEVLNFDGYKKYLKNYKKVILDIFTDDSLKKILDNAEKEFEKSEYRINQYCGFLTHTDFVPHNFRVRDGRVYLLDHSAIRIGSKHEGWGRLINFMIIHNYQLVEWILKYFSDNRSREELESLRLMRIFRLFDLIHHHAKIYNQSEHGLKDLSYKRVFFWLELLKAVLENKELDKNIIEEYKNSRDNLRSEEEKDRQRVLY